MECANCGKEGSRIMVQVSRYHEDGVSHPETCLDCIQGKNPVRDQFDIPRR
jgi:hypothetical protein